MQPTFSPLSKPGNTLFTFLAIGIVLIYIASCFTPLHLHFDSIRYYDIKDCIELGCPPDSFAANDFLPIGYTALLVTLSKLGILNAFFIVFVNCLYLFAALYFVKKIFGQHVHPVLFIVVTLFNWALIKFVAHPLSEMQYIFFSCASLYCFHGYLKKNNYLLLGLAFVFCLLTVLTRTVGISLAPALVLGIAWHHRANLTRIIRNHKWLMAGAAVVIVAGMVLTASQLKITAYTEQFQYQFSQGIGEFIVNNLRNHFRELGELFVNMPSTKLLSFLPSPAGLYLFVALGIAVFAWIMYCTFAKRSQIPFYIQMYILFYSLIILNWPYYDPRFWLPILPLIIIVLLRTPFNSKPLLKFAGRAYLVFYLATGLFAAGYALKAGFNKEDFAKKQASGAYRNEYEVHFFGKTLSDTARVVDQNIVDILNKYD